MSDHAVELVLTTKADALPMRNLYPLYLHEVASYEHKPPNRHGVLADSDDVRTWDELFDGQAALWEKPGVLFPYLIRADGVPAGFSWIMTGPYVPAPDLDVVQHEFFVAHAWRGTGVAEEAFRLGYERHRGRWELVTWPTAARSIAFWRRTLRRCTGGAVAETTGEHEWGPRVMFRFDNSIER